MSVCRNCDHAMKAGSRFCPICGEQVEASRRRVVPIRRGSLVLIVALTVFTLVATGVAMALVFTSKGGPKVRAADQEPSSSVVAEATVGDETTTLASTVPPTTLLSRPKPTTTVPNGTEDLRVIAQSLESALATHDWSSVRLHPAYAATSDENFDANYGGLQQGTVTIVRTTALPSGQVDARIGAVAWEDIGTGPRTNVYCFTWTIDPGIRRVVKSRDFLRVAAGNSPGYTRPADEEALIRSDC
jgi:hypothetical protein